MYNLRVALDDLADDLLDDLLNDLLDSWVGDWIDDLVDDRVEDIAGVAIDMDFGGILILAIELFL